VRLLAAERLEQDVVGVGQASPGPDELIAVRVLPNGSRKPPRL
jgi:hypothetical protein